MCPICLDTYTNPKLLRCFHVYCQGCLVNLVSKDQLGNSTIACPVCKQVSPVPQGGVEGLQAAFHINRRLKAMREKSETGEKSGEKASEVDFCPDHADERAMMYCETCGVLICSKCVSRGNKHHRHDYDLLGKAFEKYKEEIGSSIKPMEEKLASVKKALEALDESCSNVTDQDTAIEATISNAMKQIHMILDTRQTDLLDQLQQVTDAKMRDLSVQRDKLESTHDQLTGAMDFVRESSTGAGGERLMMRTTTSLHPDDLKPVVEADVGFEASPDVTAACQNFGELSMAETSKGKGVDGRSAKAIRHHKACTLYVRLHSVVLLASFPTPSKFRVCLHMYWFLKFALHRPLPNEIH